MSPPIIILAERANWVLDYSDVTIVKYQILNGYSVIIVGRPAEAGDLCLKPFPKRRILDSSKLEGFADDNFKFDNNGRNFSKWVENTAGKGEIARNEQFLLFPQCFQKTCSADA